VPTQTGRDRAHHRATLMFVAVEAKENTDAEIEAVEDST